MSTQAAGLREADYIVLLPASRMAAQRERLEALLCEQFPDVEIQVAADQADLCGRRGYCVMPVYRSRPNPAAPSQMIVSVAGDPILAAEIARTLAAFVRGGAGRLN